MNICMMIKILLLFAALNAGNAVAMDGDDDSEGCEQILFDFDVPAEGTDDDECAKPTTKRRKSCSGGVILSVCDEVDGSDEQRHKVPPVNERRIMRQKAKNREGELRAACSRLHRAICEAMQHGSVVDTGEHGDELEIPVDVLKMESAVVDDLAMLLANASVVPSAPSTSPKDRRILHPVCYVARRLCGSAQEQTQQSMGFDYGADGGVF